MNTNTNTAAFPSAFHCEQTHSKSRVLALVTSVDGPETLTAVLTLNDARLARRVTKALNGALLAVPGPKLGHDIEKLAGDLPDAPRASFVRALSWLANRQWPSYEIGGSSAPGGEHDPEEGSDEYARAPKMARLAQFQGPVIRIGSMREFYVHDPQRLIVAATADGWTGAVNDRSEETKRVFEAAMWLAESRREMPGTDLLINVAVGDVLDPETDEIADWTEDMIELTFFGGEHLEPGAVGSIRENPGTRRPSPRPDYANLFPAPACSHHQGAEKSEWGDAEWDAYEDCAECAGFEITARSAAVLSAAFKYLADEGRMDIEFRGDRPVDANENWYVFDQLPQITWGQSGAWRELFAQAADFLAADLDHGRLPLPTCTAEEMALHLALDQSAAIVEEIASDVILAEAIIGGVPEHPEDYDWALYGDVFVKDTDVLRFFNDTSGHVDRGIELNDWFETFPNMTPRHQVVPSAD